MQAASTGASPRALPATANLLGCSRSRAQPFEIIVCDAVGRIIVEDGLGRMRSHSDSMVLVEDTTAVSPTDALDTSSSNLAGLALTKESSGRGIAGEGESARRAQEAPAGALRPAGCNQSRPVPTGGWREHVEEVPAKEEEKEGSADGAEGAPDPELLLLEWCHGPLEDVFPSLAVAAPGQV